MSRLPGFLVVGSMKSGTTSLYKDLRNHHGIHLAEKESSGLLDPEVASPDGLSSYTRLFRGAPVGALIGEVATTYTMAPHVDGVVERAARLFVDGVKIIYIVREPVARVISHHYHDYSSGAITTDIDTAVRQDARLLDYSRYATQIRPWMDTFGRDAVKIVKFEDYIADRANSMAETFRFLDLPSLNSTIDFQIHNASDGKPVATARWRRVLEGKLYRQRIRPLIPGRLRTHLVSTLLPEAPPRPSAPSHETVEHILQSLAADLADLAKLTNGRVTWDQIAMRQHAAVDRV